MMGNREERRDKELREAEHFLETLGRSLGSRLDYVDKKRLTDIFAKAFDEGFVAHEQFNKDAEESE